MGEGRDVLDALTYSGKRALGESQSKDASVPVTAARRRFFALSATSTVTVAVRSWPLVLLLRLPLCRRGVGDRIKSRPALGNTITFMIMVGCRSRTCGYAVAGVVVESVESGQQPGFRARRARMLYTKRRKRKDNWTTREIGCSTFAEGFEDRMVGGETRRCILVGLCVVL